MITSSLRDIPDDLFTGDTNNPFLTRESLNILERSNPCSQQYHLIEQGDRSKLFVCYTHVLNLLTFLGLSLPYRTQIIGLPLSQAYPGFDPSVDTLLFPELKGLSMILNAPEMNIPEYAMGHTLPSCVLELRWANFNDYLEEMRSHYRYRNQVALDKWHDVTVTQLQDNSEFSPDLYTLYTDVYERSKYKLEKLDISFFREFPGDIYTIQADEHLLGFLQVHKVEDVLIFMFAGLNYKQVKKYDTYRNILLEIIILGISRGCKRIDFGQTTEDTKLKLGCRIEPKFMYLRHSNPVLNWLIHRFISLFAYTLPSDDFRVFKDQS